MKKLNVIIGLLLIVGTITIVFLDIVFSTKEIYSFELLGAHVFVALAAGIIILALPPERLNTIWNFFKPTFTGVDGKASAKKLSVYVFLIMASYIVYQSGRVHNIEIPNNIDLQDSTIIKVIETIKSCRTDIPEYIWFGVLGMIATLLGLKTTSNLLHQWIKLKQQKLGNGSVHKAPGSDDID